MQSFDGLPLDKDLIFYCHVGSRSQAAAMTAAEEAVFEKEIFTLEGGIMGWTGKKQAPMPRLTVFEDARTLSEFLETAMNMEKGAERFYRAAYEKFTKSNFAKTLDVLAGVETAHARLLYDIYARTGDVRDLPPLKPFTRILKVIFLKGVSVLTSAWPVWVK
ncbi:MAG: ferritin family protein [Desulfobacterales bacterium]